MVQTAYRIGDKHYTLTTNTQGDTLLEWKAPDGTPNSVYLDMLSHRASLLGVLVERQKQCTQQENKEARWWPEGTVGWLVQELKKHRLDLPVLFYDSKSGYVAVNETRRILDDNGEPIITLEGDPLTEQD